MIKDTRDVSDQSFCFSWKTKTALPVAVDPLTDLMQFKVISSNLLRVEQTQQESYIHMNWIMEHLLVLSIYILNFLFDFGLFGGPSETG